MMLWMPLNSDIIASTDDDARIEKLLHKLLTERLCQQFTDKDITIWLEVIYFRPPAPEIALKFFLTEGDHIHPPVRARFNLEFGPEDA